MENVIPGSLNWACRRGMLELDVLLGKFLKNCYGSLAGDDQKLFEKLITCEDQDLFNWLLGSATPSDPLFVPMIQAIRDYARHSSTT